MVKITETPIYKTFNSDNNEIKAKRFETIVKKMISVQEKTILKLEEEIEEAETKAALLLDVFPRQTTDLQPSISLEEIEQTMAKLNALELEIQIKTQELNVAKNLYKKHFTATSESNES